MEMGTNRNSNYFENEFINRLLEIANNLNITTDNVHKTNEQVDRTIKSTTDTVQYITKGADTLSNQTNIVLQEVKKAQEAAEKGKTSASKVSEKMNTIKLTAEEGSNKVQSLGEKSTLIGSATKASSLLSFCIGISVWLHWHRVNPAALADNVAGGMLL